MSVVMLYDWLNAQTTQVFDDNIKSFELECIHYIVIVKKINTEIGMSGMRADLVWFHLKWLNEEDDIVKIISAHEDTFCEQKKKLCFVRIIDET